MARSETERGTDTVPVKVLVWDLDETLWHGVLAEGDDVLLRPGIRDTLEALDRRGILQSIASKNEHDDAMVRLRDLDIDSYFLYPQISWSAKSGSIKRIAEAFNLGLDAVAFIDDQPFEREEVRHHLPQVRTYDADEVALLADKPELVPRFITDESAQRRHMYAADIARNEVASSFEGPEETFLANLEMVFSIGPCRPEDLERAEELTVRTNQLNATGLTYGYEELDTLRRSDDHLLLVAELDDRFGTYGKIGLALIEKGSAAWSLKLLLMSCRVMSRGVGTILLHHIMRLAHEAGVSLRAEFKPTDRNRMMLMTYRFAGFKEVERRGEVRLLESDKTDIPSPPAYVDLRVAS